MQTVLMPYQFDNEFVVSVTYEGGSELQSQNNKLKQAIEEAEGMVTFGLAVIARKVLRNTQNIVQKDGKLLRVFEVLF